jgi:hypothetical protein
VVLEIAQLAPDFFSYRFPGILHQHISGDAEPGRLSFGLLHLNYI